MEHTKYLLKLYIYLVVFYLLVPIHYNQECIEKYYFSQYFILFQIKCNIFVLHNTNIRHVFKMGNNKLANASSKSVKLKYSFNVSPFFISTKIYNPYNMMVET